MAIEVTEANDIAERVEALGLVMPTHLAVLPRNLENADTQADLVDEATAATIRKLWRSAGLEETPLRVESQRLPRMVERSGDWVGPTIFVGSLFLTENQHAISLAIAIIKDYVTDFFKGSPSPPPVRLEVIVETTRSKKYWRARYSGPAEGLSDLPDIIRGAARENDA